MGNRVLVVWEPKGRNFLWHLNEQCQCRVGWLRRLTIRNNVLILGCDVCVRAQRYPGVGTPAPSESRQVS